MPHRTLRALLNRDEPHIAEWAERLDAARTPEETRDVVAGLLASDPSHGNPVVPVRRLLPWGAPPVGSEVVPQPVSQALARMDTPAYVQGRLMDVLEANRQARALTSGFTPGANLILTAFLGTSGPALAADWDTASVTMVRHLLDRAQRDPRDTALQALVGELSVRSERFRRLWCAEAPAPQESSIGEWRHPVVGQLRLTREKTPIEGTDGMMLVVYRAEPGSVSAVALDLLKTIPPEAVR
ncbi:hypothetical protein [Leifsonia xyli]|uniref:MmyB family transcriptional regulator n=1 Tax=Leifsonia xyli TaxID=1575 RepID=UPI003D675BF9